VDGIAVIEISGVLTFQFCWWMESGSFVVRQFIEG